MERKVRLDTAERHQLRARIDDAKRTELAAERRATDALRARSTDEIKRQTAARKAILAAVESHDVSVEPIAVVAESPGHGYLVSLGSGWGRTVELGARPRVSEVAAIHELLGIEIDWTPFSPDPAVAAAIAATVRALG